MIKTPEELRLASEEYEREKFRSRSISLEGASEVVSGNASDEEGGSSLDLGGCLKRGRR